MAKFRFVEHPLGRWRVEQKGLMFWSTVYFWGKPVRLYRDPVIPTPMIPNDARCIFDSLEEARRTLEEAKSNVSYRRVVDYEGNRSSSKTVSPNINQE